MWTSFLPLHDYNITYYMRLLGKLSEVGCINFSSEWLISANMNNYMVWGRYSPPQLIRIVFHLERWKDSGLVAPFQFAVIGSGTKVAINVIVRDPSLSKGPYYHHCSGISGFCDVQVLCPKLNSSLPFTNLLRGDKWRLLMLPWDPWTPEAFTFHSFSIFGTGKEPLA